MQILFLGPVCSHICNYLQREGHNIVMTEQELKLNAEALQDADFIISYGYRHIITSDIIRRFNNRIINLHISLLPWNRGADPNLWSFLENTPKGVTIHYMDEGIDTGDVIAQKDISLDNSETLRSAYNILSQEIQEMFVRIWPDFNKKKIIPMPQTKGIGSYHSSVDKKKYAYLLTGGWDTPVSNLIGKAL